LYNDQELEFISRLKHVGALFTSGGSYIQHDKLLAVHALKAIFKMIVISNISSFLFVISFHDSGSQTLSSIDVRTSFSKCDPLHFYNEIPRNQYVILK
jgi:hypothetical protein